MRPDADSPDVLGFEHPGALLRPELLVGIAPVIRVDPHTSTAHLIGTGFWVTEFGHLVTAWHVVDENIGADGVDRGPIFVIQTFPDRSVTVRNLVKTDKHPLFDLALSETAPSSPHVHVPTQPLTMTLDEVAAGDSVFSFSVVAADQSFEDEKWPGQTITKFFAVAATEGIRGVIRIEYAVRQTFGYVTQVFETMRDRVMLPFPCVQTDVPIYGGNSGGPLFDAQGRICAVHCTSFGGSDASFHVPSIGVLGLRLRKCSFDARAPEDTNCMLGELAVAGQIKMDPPALDGRRILRSIARWLAYVVRSLVRGHKTSKQIRLLIFDSGPASGKRASQAAVRTR